jgi:hypothetical protein
MAMVLSQTAFQPENGTERLLSTEKPVMRKVRRTLRIVLPALVIVGILAVAGPAGKPTPRPAPTLVKVTGAIQIEPHGVGDPEGVQVRFFDSSLLTCEYPGDDATQGPVFISNPDKQPSLYVTNVAGSMQKSLRFRYCAHKSHIGSADSICTDTSHDPAYYYCLTIGHGVTQAKNRNAEFDHVTFPIGSPWEISSKVDDTVVKRGTLAIATTYDVIE